jgi:hypothetical protein
MTSAIPGGAPGYDDDKDFGNNITHGSGRFPKGCANHSDQGLNVKTAQRFRGFCILAGFAAKGECEFAASG